MVTIPVVFACDNDYAPFVTTVALSILEHTKSFVAFYLICPDLSERNKKILISFFKKQKKASFSLVAINLDCFHSLPTGCHYTQAMYIRFLIPQLCPNISKIIYSDVDVIYCDDIRKMYDVDMRGFGLAAPIEEIGAEMVGEWNHSLRKKKLDIPTTHQFFQSGNLLINADYWREHHISHRLMAVASEKKSVLIAPDLDVLNVVFANNYYRFPYRYSLCTHRIGCENNNSEMMLALKYPFCIHYAGMNKPWYKKNVPFAKEWWYYAKLSPYYALFLKQSCKKSKHRFLKYFFYHLIHRFLPKKIQYHEQSIYQRNRRLK